MAWCCRFSLRLGCFAFSAPPRGAGPKDAIHAAAACSPSTLSRSRLMSIEHFVPHLVPAMCRSRAVEGIRIPSGNHVALAEGQLILITQSLGGSYTVATDTGLFRIVAENANALGFEKLAP